MSVGINLEAFRRMCFGFSVDSSALFIVSCLSPSFGCLAGNNPILEEKKNPDSVLIIEVDPLSIKLPS